MHPLARRPPLCGKYLPPSTPALSAPPPPSRGGQCDFEIWIDAGDGQNLCLQRSASRERGKEGGGGEKFPGCFLLFYPPFFRFFGFSFLFFFRVLVVNSCGWDFCSFCFLSFFFSIVKKGILGETFSVCCYRWSCVVVVFDLSDDSFFFWRRNFNWMMKEGILVINNMDSFLFFFYLELWKYI